MLAFLLPLAIFQINIENVTNEKLETYKNENPVVLIIKNENNKDVKK